MVLRSFINSIEEIADVSYLSDEMLEHRDLTTTRQLLLCVQNVTNNRNNFSLIEMFCCELKFVFDIRKKWSYAKFKSKNLVLNLTSKTKFKNENRLCYNDTCVICGFSLGTTIVHGHDSSKLPYYDFVVKKKHKFLRKTFTVNILSLLQTFATLKLIINFLKN